MIDPTRIEQQLADHHRRVDRVNRDGWRMHLRQDRPKRSRRALVQAPLSFSVLGWLQRQLVVHGRSGLLHKE